MRSGFFDNTTVWADDFAQFAAGIMTNGIIADVDSVLEVTAPTSGMKVNVAPGYAWIKGHFGKNESSSEVELTQADGSLSRIDRIVVRLDFENKTVSLTSITGTPSSTPSAPDLVRTGNIYDLGLARVSIPAGTLNITSDMIFDTRRDPDICGPALPHMSESFVYPGANNFGDIKLTACASAPLNWLICDGSAISRTKYADLFAAIGTTYGAGNGSTTFNIPDLRGRAVFGKSASGTFSALNNKGGASTKTLTTNELPSHNHSVNIEADVDIPSEDGTISTTGTRYFVKETRSTGTATERFSTTVSGNTGSKGNGSSFSILPPYIVLNYIIYTGVE